MSRTAPATLPLIDPGPGSSSNGHVRERRTGTKRSLTTIELTMAERRLLDEFAHEDGSSRNAVMREALLVLAAKRGRSIDDAQEAPKAA